MPKCIKRIVLTAGAILALFSFVSPVFAQSKGPQSAETEQIIITRMPARSGPVRSFLSRLFGHSGTDKLETTGTEVVSVPKEKSAWLMKRLQRLGCTVVKLNENWHHILKPNKTPPKLSPTQQAMIDKKTASPETVGVGVLSMPDAAVAELALTRFEQQVGTKGAKGPPEDRYAKVVLPLSETSQVTLVRTRPPVGSAKGVTWFGEVEGTGERALLMLWKDGHLSGYFGHKGRVFMVNHMGKDIHTMAEIDPGKLPPDHAPTVKGDPASRDLAAPRPLPITPPVGPGVPPFPDSERLALEAKHVTIDVMLLYTPAAANHYVRDPAELLDLAIETANETFRNSGLGNVKLRLVHSQAIDYHEGTDDQFDHLYRMVDGKGPFKEIKRLRYDKRADIVGLILHDPQGCGLSTRVGADADEAYFVVHHSCAAITYSIAHEIGHILGARHDRAIDTNETPFPFAHGYVNGTKWRDMMSYREGCGGCPRIPFWSNPRVLYKGEPTGTAAADNARVILLQAERVANFR
jgi:hypothetical protein